ncbi:MAG: hypothetical protein DYH13_03285 [Alphaproteobacteria bacterium PRO2]|nr:hypothetical protein [Alphaproteobacteria bacterium PRO2]
MPAQSIKKHDIDVEYTPDDKSFHVLRDLNEVFVASADMLKTIGVRVHPDAMYGFGEKILKPSFIRAASKTDDLKTMIELALIDVAGPKARENHKTEFDSLVARV